MNDRRAPVVPDDLAEIDQWVLWTWELRHGKQAKVPYSTKLYRASSTRFTDCSDFETACDVLRKHAKFVGLGFVFYPEDPFVGIDLDDCLDRSGALKDWARPIVERFADTYCEISPSGEGLKIWARGKLPANVADKKYR